MTKQELSLLTKICTGTIRASDFEKIYGTNTKKVLIFLEDHEEILKSFGYIVDIGTLNNGSAEENEDYIRIQNTALVITVSESSLSVSKV